VIQQKGFIYLHQERPGLGIAASNPDEGWMRLNFYAPGLEIDRLHLDLRASHGEGALEGLMRTVPTTGAAIVAGGMVFKSITCLANPERESMEMLKALEKQVNGFAIRYPRDLVRAESIDPSRAYWTIYGHQVLGQLRVVFFEYATQVAIMGVARAQDLGLVDEIYDGLQRLKDYYTVPNPLRTQEFDARVEITMFMIRVPLKEEAELEFTKKIAMFPGLAIFDPLATPE